MLSENIVTALYIAASVLFILSLGGLSGQESAKRAVWYGIVGMALAVIDVRRQGSAKQLIRFSPKKNITENEKSVVP